MDILFFTSRSDTGGKIIAETIQSQHPEKRVEIYTHPESLFRKLLNHRDFEAIAVLLPDNEERMIELYSMQNVLDKTPIMLVLPKKDKFMEAMGYRLRPLLLCYREIGMLQVASKLGNTIKRLYDIKGSGIPIQTKSLMAIHTIF